LERGKVEKSVVLTIVAAKHKTPKCNGKHPGGLGVDECGRKEKETEE